MRFTMTVDRIQRRFSVFARIATAIVLVAIAHGARPAAASESAVSPVAASVVAVPAADLPLPAQMDGQSAEAPPMSRAHVHVFLAFGAAWLLVFLYILTIGRRLRRLRDEVRRLDTA